MQSTEVREVVRILEQRENQLEGVVVEALAFLSILSLTLFISLVRGSGAAINKSTGRSIPFH